MTYKTEVHRTQYRLPQPMASWLKERAATHFRSMNAELLEIIREAMEKDGQTNAKTAS